MGNDGYMEEKNINHIVVYEFSSQLEQFKHSLWGWWLNTCNMLDFRIFLKDYNKDQSKVMHRLVEYDHEFDI